MSDYQPPAQGGWPAQPPASGGPGNYGPGDYGQPRNDPAYAPTSYQQAGYGQAPGGPGPRPPRRRRRRRWPTVLVILVVLLLAVAAIGDQVAKSYAQNRIAERIQANADMSRKPSVSIEGWPFLTQIARHDLKAVDISASNVTANSRKLTFSFTAKATGVHLNSSFSRATVDHINGQAVIPFSNVASLLSLPAGLVTLRADPAAGPNAIKADAGILGSLTGTVTLASPAEIAIHLSTASGLASLLGGLAGQSYTIAIPKLPAGLVVQSVSVTSQGIVADASASNTTLTQ